ncbi:precorrin-6y C5,15-methyltransferase (decarboxylating) subunit CbiE [Chelatococcus reniformis]|nr:precorrin-6y C5,15-methyltransferase (decarboxylating) subunit CbiE [Chelatococcus reniformis]
MASDSRPTAANKTGGRWLSVVGIGEDGAPGLGARARALVSGADLVFGGARHLALAAELIGGEARAWPSPFSEGIAAVLAARGRPVCVLASGDPMLYGVGATLSRHIDAAEMEVVPGASAFSLAAARLGWPLAETAQVSAHGRALDLVRPQLQPGARVLALTSDGAGPAALAALLVESGFGGSRLVVLEALGGPGERVREATAAGFALEDIGPLNLVAIEVAADAGARVLTLASGLADDLFEHDGQLSKREIRALTLSSLAPRAGELLWDIGAGAGSIAIEWMLRGAGLTAIAIEERTDRAERIVRNAARCGVPGLRLVVGKAPAALDGLPAPDAVFIGGGASDPGVLDAAISALKPSGRLVVNAVTLETEALLLAAHRDRGGALTRLAVARAAPVAGMTGWRPAMPVTQWRWRKP